MCVLGNNGPACICPDGYPKDSKNTCLENMNTKLIFNSSLVIYKNESIRHQNGTLIGIIITVLACRLSTLQILCKLVSLWVQERNGTWVEICFILEILYHSTLLSVYFCIIIRTFYTYINFS